MRHLYIFALLYLCLIVGECSNKAGTPEQPAPPDGFSVAAFAPPADSAIDPRQAQAWLACGRFLDALSQEYPDDLLNEIPQQRSTHEAAFIKAQDSICVVAGLKGGYREYLWILDASRFERNKHLFNAAPSTKP